MFLHKPIITTGAAIGFLVTSALIGLALITTHSNSIRNCRAALDVRDALVVIMVDAQHRVERTPAQTINEQQRKDALDFYNKSIAKLKAVKCSH